jgi:tetratricopeptide (TPR) repeat protein
MFENQSSAKISMKQYLYLLFAFFLLNCSDQDNQEAAEFFERGVYHFKKNELDVAHRFFTEAIGKQPNLADAYNNIGLIDEIRGKDEKALEAFEKAISIDPEFQQAIFNQGRVLSHLGQNQAALASFENVSQIYKDSAEFYVARGFVYMNVNNTGAAIIDFKRAISLKPENSQAFTNLGYSYIEERNYPLAQESLIRAIEINPDGAAAHNNLAFLYGIIDKQLSKPIYHAEIAVRLEPTNNLYRNNYAYSLLINNELAKAERELDIVSKNLAENSYYLRNKGLLNYLKGDYAAAKGLLTQAETKDPGTVLIYYYLGLNEKAMGNPNEAKAYFTTGATLEDSRSQAELRNLGIH